MRNLRSKLDVWAEGRVKSLTKSRFSIIGICKTITVLGIVANVVLFYYTIEKQKGEIESLRGYNTTLEGQNEECFNRWKELEERGEVIYTIKYKEAK